MATNVLKYEANNFVSYHLVNTMWNPVYEKCGKIVGITVQIMFLSDVGRRC